MYHLWLLSGHSGGAKGLHPKASGSQSLKYVLSDPLQKKFANHQFRWIALATGSLQQGT